MLRQGGFSPGGSSFARKNRPLGVLIEKMRAFLAQQFLFALFQGGAGYGLYREVMQAVAGVFRQAEKQAPALRQFSIQAVIAASPEGLLAARLNKKY